MLMKRAQERQVVFEALRLTVGHGIGDGWRALEAEWHLRGRGRERCSGRQRGHRHVIGPLTSSVGRVKRRFCRSQ